MKLPRRDVKRGRVEIVPMIDTILILLIFYMSFSTFRKTEKRLAVPLPERKPVALADRGIIDRLELHVQSSGLIMVNGNAYDLSSLGDSLASIGTFYPNTIVMIDADADTSYQSIINVLDLCARAKLSHLVIRPLSTTPVS